MFLKKKKRKEAAIKIFAEVHGWDFFLNSLWNDNSTDTERERNGGESARWKEVSRVGGMRVTEHCVIVLSYGGWGGGGTLGRVDAKVWARRLA